MSQLLAKISSELYDRKKSDVLPVFKTCDTLLTGPTVAVVIELCSLVQTHDLTNSKTFLDLALALYSRISKIAARCIRVDVITNRYVNGSLNEGTWGARGNEEATFGNINDHDETSNFQKDFIRNSLNKDALYQYLAERFIDLYSSTTQILVVTYKDAILKTEYTPDDDKLVKIWRNWCSCDKRFDQQCQMFDTIVVYSSDTDVLLLCLACHHQVELEGSTCTFFCKIVLGSSLEIYNVNVSAWAICLNTYRALPFFHVLTGYDAVSNFFNAARRVCEKPGISIQITAAWPKYSKLLVVHLNEFTRFN